MAKTWKQNKLGTLLLLNINRESYGVHSVSLQFDLECNFQGQMTICASSIGYNLKTVQIW